MKSLPDRLKLSPFSHVFNKGDKVAVYNSLNQEVFYGGKKLKQVLEKYKTPSTPGKNPNYVKQLFEARILVSEDYDEKKPLKKVRKLVEKPNISSIYLITTDKCNYACKYCFIESKMKDGHNFKKMTDDVMKKGVDVFSDLQKKNENKESEALFYGGEPLLNKERLFSGVEYLNEKVKTGQINNLNKVVFTNGSLITKNIAGFFKQENMGVGISIDGWKEVHNKMRTFLNGKGTFEQTIKGYNHLKEAGCNIGISCTVSTHNINLLDKIVEYFATELEGRAMSFNPLFDINNGKLLEKAFLEHMADKIIEAYDVARAYGVYEDRVTKFIRPFVKQSVRLVDCSGCGRQVVVSPDGEIGPCHAFVGDKKFFSGNVFEGFNPKEDKNFNEWSKRSPFNMEKCLNCPSLSICGGGCAYNAQMRKGSIWNVDERTCYLAKKILKKIIWEGFENVEKRSEQESIDKPGKKGMQHLNC